MIDVSTISLAPIQAEGVAILGYGNQGQAHALNLRDSGVEVMVGARPGPGWERARKDGFEPLPFPLAIERVGVVMLLLPDQEIAATWQKLKGALSSKAVGVAHSFALVFGGIELTAESSFFLVGPKGAGALLRENFKAGGGLPGVFAVSRSGLRDLAMSYAKAIGCASSLLLETTFREEAECDLFGEQAVLCGGMLELMAQAFEILVERGHSPEMAFLECCYEARLILELWMKYGPKGLADRISPTALYGGWTRGKRLITAETRQQMAQLFSEIRGGSFAEEWQMESRKGAPSLTAAKQALSGSLLQQTYEKLSAKLR